MSELPDITILVAEDDDAAALLIKKNLLRTGLEARYIRARHGVEVIDILSGNKPDVSIQPEEKLIMFLDIRMPKMDGILVLQKLKSTHAWQRIPVIMLTTSDRPQEVEECYRLGCNAYLKKQVDYSKFIDTINKLADFVRTIEIPHFGELSDE